MKSSKKNRPISVHKEKENHTWLRKSNEIAVRITDALDQLHISQAELANRLKVSRQHISKIIKGQENLTLETIARIEDVLKVVLITIPRNNTSYSETGQRGEPQEVNLKYKNGNKIKPIVYNNFEDKARLEKKLFARMPKEKRKTAAVSLMSVFHRPATTKKPVRKIR